MRVAVVGMGVQGAKRRKVAGEDVVATVDPAIETADFRDISELDPDSYDAALVCAPDLSKLDLLRVLLTSGKHVLVEKPLLAPSSGALRELADLAEQYGVTCYTAYNHRFEPHFARMKALLDSGRLGKIYRCRLFYGNGTAEDVRRSAWRDQGAGVLPDLGSHLLDTVLYWFGPGGGEFRVISSTCFENEALDHAVIGRDGPVSLELEMTLLSWRNSFTCDVFAEHGSAHIRSLCKWAPSDFTVRWRKRPSGRPDETLETLVQPDSLHGIMHAAREVMLRTVLPETPLAVLRTSLLYGAADLHNGYGPNQFRRKAFAGEEITLFGLGEERRDHVLIDDVAEIVCRTLLRRSRGTLNIATGTVTSFKEVAEMVASQFDTAPEFGSRPRSGPMPHNGYRPFDPTACQLAFPYFRYTALAEGIAQAHAAERGRSDGRG